jgi:hypothetical protein
MSKSSHINTADASEARPSGDGWLEYKGRTRKSGNPFLTISPQSDGWNHVHPTAEMVTESGLAAGTPITFYLNADEHLLIVQEKKESVYKARPYKYGAQVQYSFTEDALPTGLARGKGVAFPNVTVTKGKITIPLTEGR